MSFLALLSPAKRLDFAKTKPEVALSEPRFAKQARDLIRHARSWNLDDVASRMKLSADLAKLNYRRYQDFRLRGSGGARQAALLAFAGDVYQGLDAGSLTLEETLAAQSHIRILSGLYGILRPLDAIQPYRLEMGTKIETDAGSTLSRLLGSEDCACP